MKPLYLVWRANVGANRPRRCITPQRKKPRSQRWAHTLTGRSSSSWQNQRKAAPRRYRTYTTHSNWHHQRMLEAHLAAASGRIRSKARGHLASKSRWKIGLLGRHRPRGYIRSTHPRKGTFIHQISYMSLQLCPTMSHWEIHDRTQQALMLSPIFQKRRI